MGAALIRPGPATSANRRLDRRTWPTVFVHENACVRRTLEWQIRPSKSVT
ncbi:hypothetical protein BZL30_5332 [Mycobacterium kansasii]|uniref:Uncharacterized protein n=1 Tax=Mycobacterium kansasii TaxID=1768 RepID=A0A1V3WYZ3_MYCKA|nr:hypothetical protein BZL30_5332 [Mycobacterium kansasii]